MALTISVNGTQLPGEIVEIRRGDELLWSDGTGRGATDGLLVGSVVAKKQTWTIRWGVVTQTDYDSIRGIPQGFFTLLVMDGLSTLFSGSAYRSNVAAEHLGSFGGTTYWKGVEVQLTER